MKIISDGDCFAAAIGSGEGGYGTVTVNNGVVNAADALLVMQYDAGWNISKPDADVNGDGAVDSKDAVRILQYCAGKISTLD